MLTSSHTIPDKLLLEYEHNRQAQLHSRDRRKSKQPSGCKRGTCEWCERARVGVGRDVFKQAVLDGKKIANATSRGLELELRDMLDCMETMDVEGEIDDGACPSRDPMEIYLADLVRPNRRHKRKSFKANAPHQPTIARIGEEFLIDQIPVLPCVSLTDPEDSEPEWEVIEAVVVQSHQRSRSFLDRIFWRY